MSEMAEFLKEKYKIPIAFALILSLQMDTYDKLCELKGSIEECYIEEEEAETAEDWKKENKNET